MKRVVQRDLKERGKDKKQAENDFLKSWDIYTENLKLITYKKIQINLLLEKKLI